MTVQAASIHIESLTKARSEEDKFAPRYAQFARWAAQRRNCPHLASDALRASSRAGSLRSSKSDNFRTAVGAAGQDNRSQCQALGKPRGRPAVITVNPVAQLMPFLGWNRPYWFDDILYGSIASSVGAHKGQLNVRVSDVYAALFLSEISTAAIRRHGMSERSVQSIAKAARHVASGIWHYLHRHPVLRDRVKNEVQTELALQPRQLPQGI